jgi:hypothetical protein
MDVKPDAKTPPSDTNNSTPGGADRRRHGRRFNRNRHQPNNNNAATPHGGKFRGKIKDIADDVFDNTGQNDAALFNKSLKNIADYLQLSLGNDVSEAVRNMAPITITIPPPPQGAPDPNDATRRLPISEVDLYLWKQEHSKASKKKNDYEDQLSKAYIIIIQQCSPALRNDLNAEKTFPAVRSAQDPLALLKLIQGLCCSYDSRVQSVMATVASHKRLYTYYQRDGVDNHTYHREFLSFVETIETYGGLGAVGVIPVFLQEKIVDLHRQGLIADATAPTDDERALAVGAVREEYLAALMISGANREKFSALRTDLQNQYGYGNDLYPKTTDQCLSLLNRWTVTTPSRPKRGDVQAPAPAQPKQEENEALVFAQDVRSPPSASPSHGTNSQGSSRGRGDSRRSPASSASISSGHRITTVKCKSCGRIGHTSSVSPPGPNSCHGC